VDEIASPAGSHSGIKAVPATGAFDAAAQGVKSTLADVRSQKIRVRSSDVTVKRVLRISTLLKYIQEGTVRHTTELGMGRDMTLDKGLLWVITQQQMTVKRLPGYDEEIMLRTWPGEQLHLFFPRYTSIVDQDSHEIVTSKTLWVLMDEKTRRPVFPRKYGVAIEGVSKPGDFPLPRVMVPGIQDTLLMKKECTALFSECDINGHMNNSEYFDLFDDMMQGSTDTAALQVPCEISAEYIDEIPYKSHYLAELYRLEKGFLLQGSSSGKDLFRIRLEPGR